MARIHFLGLTVALLVGCSDAATNGGSPPPPALSGAGGVGGGSAGAPATAGSSGTGAGAGGTPTAGAPTTDTGACVEYLRAQCERRSTCGLNTDFDSCFVNVSSCPDLLFSPGTTRTIESTLKCADAWRATSCADLAIDKLPPCVTPGTRGPGEACVFGVQCASRVCVTPGVGCGSCAAEAHLGEACGSSAVACSAGLTCDPATQLCAPKTPAQGPAGLPEVALGEVCDRVAGPSCGQNDCENGADGVYRCVPYPRLGESCIVPKTCAFDDGSYCDISEKCLAKPGDGKPCGVDAWTGRAGWCADDTFCDSLGPAPTCRALPALGAPCTAGCAGKAHCTCTDSTCAAHACQNQHSPGEPCDLSRGEACFPGVSRCENGTCVLGASQGLFQTRCGP